VGCVPAMDSLPVPSQALQTSLVRGPAQRLRVTEPVGNSRVLIVYPYSADKSLVNTAEVLRYIAKDFEISGFPVTLKPGIEFNIDFFGSSLGGGHGVVIVVAHCSCDAGTKTGWISTGEEAPPTWLSACLSDVFLEQWTNDEQVVTTHPETRQGIQ
jgi:hypothetical protein